MDVLKRQKRLLKKGKRTSNILYDKTNFSQWYFLLKISKLLWRGTVNEFCNILKSHIESTQYYCKWENMGANGKGLYILFLRNNPIYIGKSIKIQTRISQHRACKDFDKSLMLPYRNLYLFESLFIGVISPPMNKKDKNTYIAMRAHNLAATIRLFLFFCENGWLQKSQINNFKIHLGFAVSLNEDAQKCSEIISAFIPRLKKVGINRNFKAKIA